jgi:hypothetical protein
MQKAGAGLRQTLRGKTRARTECEKITKRNQKPGTEIRHQVNLRRSPLLTVFLAAQHHAALQTGSFLGLGFN